MRANLLIMLLCPALGLQSAAREPIGEAPKVASDPCESVIIAGVRGTLAELRAARQAHGGGAGAGFTAVYEGSVAIEGHMMRPGMVRTGTVKLEFAADADLRGLRLRETSGSAGAARVSTTLMLDGRIAEQGSGQGAFVEREGAEGRAAAAELVRWLPSLAVSAAMDAAASCRLGRGGDAGGQEVTFVDPAGVACTLLVDREHRVGRIESLEAHPRLGDVCQWTAPGDWSERGGVQVAQKISRLFVQATASVRYDLKLVSFVGERPGEDAFRLPEARQADIPTWGQGRSAASGFEFAEDGPGRWIIGVAAANTRVVVMEREKDLVLLGAPDNDEVCLALLAALREKFAGKPVGVVAVSHHHPSPSGGLRAIAETGATMVVPRGMEGYVRGLLARPRTLAKGASVARDEAKLELFDGERVLECGGSGEGRRVRLIDIGEKSAHAFCYVVYLFPSDGLVFEDDLGYLPEGKPVVAGPRLAGLVEALEAMKIEPRRLGQGYPLRGTVRTVEWGEVVGAVRETNERSRK